MRIAFDTNILVYAQGALLGPNDEPKRKRAAQLISDLQTTSHELLLSTQAIAEFHHVLVGRGQMPREQATKITLDLLDFFEIWPTRETTVRDALTLAADRRLQTFDAIILSAAAEARCDLLLSEDMQNGFEWRGVRIANPLAADFGLISAG